MRAPITSAKHVVQTSVQTVAFGARLNIDVAKVVDTPDAAIAVEVHAGSVIKAVYVEYWVNGTDANQSSCTAIVTKVPAGASITAGDLQALQAYLNKKNVLHTFQGLIGDSNSNPIPVIRQWIKIPKGKQRFGTGDVFVVSFLGLTADISVCGFCIYKEYT